MLWEELYAALGFHRDDDAKMGEVRPAVTNLLRNPSAETNLTAFNLSKISWAAGELVRAALPVGVGVGGFGLHVTATKDANTTGRTLSVSQSSLAGSVEPGEPCSFGIPLWVIDAIGGAFACRVDWYTATPTYISSTPGSAIFAGTGAGLVKLENQIPPATASLATVVLVGTSAVSGDTVDFWTDAWMLNQGETLAEYFDGDQPGCSWTGTPHASPSTRAAVDTTFPLRRFCEAWCAPLQPVHDLVRERDDGPAWAVLFDADLCPAESLPYLAQYVGVVITPEMSEEQIRNEIREPTGWARGRAPAIKIAAQRTLTGTKRVIVRPRTPDVGNHYIRTFSTETPDEARTRAVLRAAVPAWEALDYEAVDAVTVEDVAAGWKTVLDLAGAFTSVADLADILPNELPDP